jgi:CheY-like chemotaxis protein
MRIPLISSHQTLLADVKKALEGLNRDTEQARRPGAGAAYAAVPLADPREAIEYINYQTPALIMINFSDPGLDGFAIMEQIVADPWLNHGSIIAIYEDSKTLEQINDLAESNVIISLSYDEVSALMQKVLKVIQENQQILFHRAIHTDFTSTISGRFLLDSDIFIIPCYANLVANYLYNMGFVDAGKKGKISLSLIELLINGIEHGNCGITLEEKTEYLNRHGAIHGLVAEKARHPDIAKKRVTFQYEIRGNESSYRITDEGEGFDWRLYTDPDRETDALSLHGRGIMLTRHSADKLSYNEKGNEVEVVVAHRRNTTNTVPLVFRDRETVEVEPNDVVFQQGEESDFLYYVAEGEYRVEVNNRTLATITPADVLMGEMSFLLQEARSATVIANTRGRLIKISNVAFVNSIKAQPYYGLFLAKLLAKRLYTLGRTIVN